MSNPHPTFTSDVVLQDFCEIVGLYDNDSIERHERMYFRKIHPQADVEPVGSLGTCEPAFLDLPWESRASSCALLRPPTGTTSGTLPVQLRSLNFLVMAAIATMFVI
jgi:hypothetical protein